MTHNMPILIVWEDYKIKFIKWVYETADYQRGPQFVCFMILNWFQAVLFGLQDAEDRQVNTPKKG